MLYEAESLLVEGHKMTFHLFRIGQLPLPRGIAARGFATLDKLALNRRGLSQTELSAEDEQHLRGRLHRATGDLMTHAGRHTNLLAFRAVEEHDDGWEDMRFKGRMVATAFLHVVLAGRFELRVGRKKMAFRRGDVFFMNPNVRHEVITKSLCLTYCAEVPGVAALKFVKHNAIAS